MPEEILIVRHGPARVAVDLAVVREVLRMVAPAPLPGAPRGILGAVNLRGESIPLLDLEARLAAGAGTPGLDHHILVVQSRGMPLALVVSRAQEIESVVQEAWRDTRESLPDAPILGIVRFGTELVPVLDVDRLLLDPERRTLEELLERLREEAP